MSNLPTASIRAYDKDLNLLAIIDICSTVYFERGLSEAGAFELQINYNLTDSAGFRYSDYFQRGNFITVGTDMRRIGVIMEVTKAISESGKGSQTVSVKGYEAKALFGRRIVYPPTGESNYTDSNPAETVIKNVLIEQIGSGADASRQMAIFNILGSQGQGATFQYSSRFKNLADDIKVISESTGLGIFNTLNLSTKKIDIDAIVGVDRIASQSVNPRCIISTKYDTLRAGQLTDSEVSYKNVVVAAGQGVGTDRNIQVVYDGAEPTGIERREVMQDMRDLETTGELLARASSTLQELAVTKFVDASALSYSQYVLGVDYDLGDYITTEIYDESEDVQITKVKESWAPNQYNIELVFNRAYPEMPKQIKAREQATAQVLANVETGTGLNSTTVGGNTAAQLLNLGNATGTLADARLSTNVPLLNAANTFSGFNNKISGNAISAGIVELGSEGTGDRNAYIDFHSTDTDTDYSLRLIRGSGVNGQGSLQHKGTGSLSLNCEGLASVELFTNNTKRLEILSSGNVGLVNFTRLGTDTAANIGIKVKKITGTVSNTAGAATNVSHGLTDSKIIGFTIQVFSDSTRSWYVQQGNTVDTLLEFYAFLWSGYLSIKTTGSNSTQVLNRPFTCTIIYEE